MHKEFKKKIKVLRIIARLNIGGPARHTILLAQGLNREEFDSILLAGAADRAEGDMLYLAKDKDIDLRVIPQLQRRINLLNDIIAFWKIFFQIKKEEPDIIHTHTAKAGALARLAGAMYNAFCGDKRCRLVHTFHGTVLQGYFGKIRSRVFIWIERALAYFTDRVIVVSGALKEELLNLKIGNPEKLAVIPLGLDMGQLLSLAPADNGRLIRIGIVGRLVRIKNHKMFLNGARKFLDTRKPDDRPCRFFIIGDGELRQDLEQYALDLGVSGSVEFCGWSSDIREVYNLLDIVVSTSLNEGTPLALIEAMAAARPVIATGVGGTKDLFTKSIDYGLGFSDRIKICDNGILCNSEDASGLAEALNLLCGNPGLRKEMGERGRIFAKERFSKERLIKDMEMLYNTCLTGSN